MSGWSQKNHDGLITNKWHCILTTGHNHNNCSLESSLYLPLHVLGFVLVKGLSIIS